MIETGKTSHINKICTEAYHSSCTIIYQHSPESLVGIPLKAGEKYFYGYIICSV